MKSILIVPFCIAISASPLFAQGAPAGASAPVAAVSGEIVVTASAGPDTLESSPAAVTVITREEIEKRAAREVADVLREVPGLTVSRSGSPGKITSLFTRGGSSKQTLVLWNGIELNNPYFSGYDFGHFSTAGVERIEVVRGPFSALYGSEAVSGVVNVITAPRSSFLTAEVQMGERELVNGRVDGAAVTGPFRFLGGVEHRSDAGFAPNDDAAQNTVLGQLDWSPSPRFSLGARARWIGYDVGTPRSVDASGTAFEPRPDRRESGEELELALPIRARVAAVEWELVVSRMSRTDEFEDPDDPFGRTWAITDVDVDRAALTGRTLLGRHVLSAGAEWDDAVVRDASSYGTSIDSEERGSRGVFLEDRLSFRIGSGILEAGVGVRYDDYDTFGSETSPRAALAWLLGRNKFRAGYGEAFRAPAIGELYIPFFGNRDLESERSASWELGFERYFEDGRVSLTAFRNDFDELIVYDNVTNRFENVGAGTADGMELGWSQQVSPTLGFSISWTYVKTEDADTGLEFLRRPENSGSASVHWRDFGWGVSLLGIHSGDRADLTDLFPYGRVRSPAFATVDLVVERDLGGLVPYVKVENATGEEYEEVFGYPSPGRRVIAGIRARIR